MASSDDDDKPSGIILICDIPVVLDTIRWYRLVQSKHNYLLLRLHVSALALGQCKGRNM